MNKVKILDFLTRKHVWEDYQVYNKTQWFSKDEVKELQLSKLKKLLQHCYTNIPYYRSIIEKNNIDISNIESLDVLFKFPILTKEIIQENYKSFYSEGEIIGSKTSQTGGTTGNILLKRNDTNTRSSIWATYKRFEDWMGLGENEKVLILKGGHVKKQKIKAKLVNAITAFLSNAVSVDIYDTNDETIEQIIILLKTHKFSLIKAYPQFLYSVAQKMEQEGLTFDIKSITTTAEPVMEEHRVLFKRVFNAEVFDQYGCGEIGGIAYECDRHDGMHIAEERVILETNKNNELIITDLDNFTMPFIRYWNADQAMISDKVCSCGRQSELILKIMGRTCDYIIGINGKFLHWAYFWHLIFDSNIALKRNLKKFQIVQETETDIVVNFVADNLNQEEESFIKNDIKNRLGNMIITIVYKESIENSKTGKYRPVINLII